MPGRRSKYKSRSSYPSFDLGATLPELV
jgi:hypothetical protein